MKFVDAILIMASSSSLPIIFQNLNPKMKDIEPSLLSGFISAFQTFSTHVIEKTERSEDDFLDIDYGKRKLLVVSYECISIIALHRGAPNIIKSYLKEIAKEFLEQFECADFEIGINVSLFEPFRLKLIKKVIHEDISPWWIPRIKKNEFIPQEKRTWLYNLIDGKSTMTELCNKDSTDPEVVEEEIFLGWSNGFIDFGNILDEIDVIIPTLSTRRLFLPYNPDFLELSAKFSECQIDLKELVKSLDGKTTLKELEASFGPVCKEFIEFLWDKDYLAILSPEKRRILIAKSISAKLIDVLYSQFEIDGVLDFFNQALSDTLTLGFSSEINVVDDKVIIDFSFKEYEQLSPNDVLSIFNDWTTFNKALIAYVPSEKRDVVIEGLADQLDFDFFESFRAPDMEGLDEFTSWLEELIA